MKDPNAEIRKLQRRLKALMPKPIRVRVKGGVVIVQADRPGEDPVRMLDDASDRLDSQKTPDDVAKPLPAAPAPAAAAVAPSPTPAVQRRSLLGGSVMGG